jgi:hypothetical protein
VLPLFRLRDVTIATAILATHFGRYATALTEAPDLSAAGAEPDIYEVDIREQARARRNSLSLAKAGTPTDVWGTRRFQNTSKQLQIGLKFSLPFLQRLTGALKYVRLWKPVLRCKTNAN